MEGFVWDKGSVWEGQGFWP